MLKARSRLLGSLLQVADAVGGGVIVLALARTDWATSASVAGGGWTLAAVACFAWPTVLGHLHLYESQRRTSLLSLGARFALAGALTTAALMAAAFALGRPPSDARFVLATGVVSTLFLGGFRLAIVSALRVARRLGRNYRNLVIVGTGQQAVYVRRQIERHPAWGLRVVGFVDKTEGPISPEIARERVHKLADLPKLIREEVVDEVIIAAPRSLLPSLGPAVAACAEAGVPFTMMGDIFGDYLPPPRLALFGSAAALRFAPVHHGRGRLAVKRAMDAAGAAAGLLVSAPVLAAGALAIRLTSPGPIFYRQTRCGLHGHPFQIVKLRTMCVDAELRLPELMHLNEMDGPVFKLRSDPRITPVGKFLRRYSIDEIPQLWNVLRGEMSLVGPRPPTAGEVAQYQHAERRRLSMRPGLTCYWQVSGRNQIGFDDWLKLDLRYIDTWSLTTDLRILLRTIPVVLSGTGQ